MTIVKCHWLLSICSKKFKVSSQDDSVTSDFKSLHCLYPFDIGVSLAKEEKWE